ncbi:MAG: DUF4139 domain-containing protein [Chitinophagaceae bacterium]|nr:DUF4139 domain-containing protein [Chitinophagaceae bacterium]
MRKIIFISFLVLLSIGLKAQQPITTQATLNAVTVYSTAAELSHSARASLPAGNSELVIRNISSTIDENSIQVGSDKDLTILSVSFRKEFLTPKTKTPEIKRIEDSIKILESDLEQTRILTKTQENVLSILDANKQVGGSQTGLNVVELQKLVEYYLTKHAAISQTVQTLKQKEKVQWDKLNQLKQQLNEMTQVSGEEKGEIVLQILNSNSTTANFNISYLSYTAAWSPMYDLKTKDTKSPLRLIYKGNIVQRTGLDWNHVKLTLSTGNPSQSGNAPILSTWFLQYYQPVYKSYDQNVSRNIMQTYGSAPASATLGYQDKEIVATEKMQEKTMNKFTTVSETALNASFDIELPYDIPSDNKSHSVSMKEYELPAVYKYYSVPKMDKDAFLIAEIADWEQLNLIPGPANIIFDGTYVGKSFIDPNSTQDTLNISLGRDRKIVVKREKVMDYCSSKLIGTNKLHTVTYEIKVKNTRKESIQLLLKDQHPISSNKEIEVNLLESSDAAVNAETGVLTWKLDIPAGETRKVKVSYSVKFPKDKTMGNLF